MSHNVIFLLVRILSAGILLGIQFYLYKIVLQYFQRSHRFKKYREQLRWLFILLNAPVLYVVFGQHIALPRWIVASIMYPYSIWQGATLFTIIVLFLWKMMAIPIRLIRRRMRRSTETAPAIPMHGTAASSRSLMFDDTRRRFLQTSGIGLAIYSFGGATLGVIRHDNFEIVQKDILLRALPEKLHGLRVVVLSDIHAGLYMDKSDLDEYVRVVNKLSADMILLPGDFVTNQTIEVYPVCDAFQQLRSRYGIFGCTGNHEYFAEEDLISNELDRAGLRMLRNAHEIIEIKNEKIALIGVDDTRGKVPLASRLQLAHENLDPTLPTILLCHKPYEFEEAQRFDIDLMVSGHTHGGQIVFAEIFGAPITPASLISKYVQGLFVLGSSQLYVTRGIGTVGLPIRLNCPPEITVLTLRAEVQR